MKALSSLPLEYEEILSVDLQKNKKLSLLLNGLALVVALLMAVPMSFVVPISTLYNMDQGIKPYAIRFGVLLLMLVVYMLLHEAVHGIAMKICGTKKVKYGFTGLYAFAGSSDYYDKKSYIFIALSPVVIWGVIIGIINFFVPTQWFWAVYIIQIINISGAVGDLYVTVRFSKLSKDILITDCGVGMTVYERVLQK